MYNCKMVVFNNDIFKMNIFIVYNISLYDFFFRNKEMGNSEIYK